MSNSNDGNNALVACNGSTLHAEQNDMRTFLDCIKNDVNSDRRYTDEELRNSIIQLLNIAFPVLIKTQEYDMLGILVQLMLEYKITIEEKKLIVRDLLSFARDNRWMQFWDFFYKEILPKTSVYGIIKESLESSLKIKETITEAQAISQIRINEAVYYSHLRIDEEREKSQIRLNEEAARSQIRINEYCQKKKANAEIKLQFREKKHKQDLQFAEDAKKHKEEKSHT